MGAQKNMNHYVCEPIWHTFLVTLFLLEKNDNHFQLNVGGLKDGA